MPPIPSAPLTMQRLRIQRSTQPPEEGMRIAEYEESKRWLLTTHQVIAHYRELRVVLKTEHGDGYAGKRNAKHGIGLTVRWRRVMDGRHHRKEWKENEKSWNHGGDLEEVKAGRIVFDPAPGNDWIEKP